MPDQSNTEALARALCAAAGLNPDVLVVPLGLTRYWQQAERLLADPGPLLAALAEAGVLTVEEDVDWCQERCTGRSYYGEECGNTCRRTDDHATAHECVNGHYFPREPGEVVGTRERRYVTEWRPADE